MDRAQSRDLGTLYFMGVGCIFPILFYTLMIKKIAKIAYKLKSIVYFLVNVIEKRHHR